jgi:hypothetical protein
MKLYSGDHLQRIELAGWAQENLNQVHFASAPKITAHTYYIPTKEFEEMVSRNNLIAALKGYKICKPVYKSTYMCRHRNILVISN